MPSARATHHTTLGNPNGTIINGAWTVPKVIVLVVWVFTSHCLYPASFHAQSPMTARPTALTINPIGNCPAAGGGPAVGGSPGVTVYWLPTALRMAAT